MAQHNEPNRTKRHIVNEFQRLGQTEKKREKKIIEEEIMFFAICRRLKQIVCVSPLLLGRGVRTEKIRRAQFIAIINGGPLKNKHLLRQREEKKRERESAENLFDKVWRAVFSY